jgi:hypothetical protein
MSETKNQFSLTRAAPMRKGISRKSVIRWTAIVATFAAIVGWWSRTFQVGLFLAAAGCRRKTREAAEWSRAIRTAEWSSPSPTERPTAMHRPNHSALITFHPEYLFFTPTLVDQALIKATELNAAWLRTDVRWHQVLPDGDQVDVKALSYYRGFLARAQAHGFCNLVVLSSPPKVVMESTASQRMTAWSRFVEVVVKELGGYCQSYQLMNEPNNPAYSFFSKADVPLAIAGAARLIKTHYPAAEIAVNVSMDIWGWRGYLEDLLSASGNSVDIVGLDHYPGTWTIGCQARWNDVCKLAKLIHSAPQGSPWFKRRLGIMETGFSTNTLGRGELEQARYFAGLRDVAASLRIMSGTFAFLGAYELCDEDSNAHIDPEAHFGLLNSHLEPKKAFSTVRDLMTAL